MNKVLFIGAGASYGAREGLRPPLGKDLCNWLRIMIPRMQEEGVLFDLRGTINTASSILEKKVAGKRVDSFEKLLSELTFEESVVIHRLLQIAFFDFTELSGESNLDLCFKNKSDEYDRLIKHLDFKTNEWDVVSLNYDLLFEQSLKRNEIDFYYPRMPFVYGDKQFDAKGVKVFKPHGSINFFAHQDPNVSPPDFYKPLESKSYKGKDGRNRTEHPFFYAVGVNAEDIISRASLHAIEKPVMALYTKGKPAYINEEILIEIRDESCESFAKANEVFIVGVNLIRDPSDDECVTRLVNLSHSKKTTYVSVGEKKEFQKDLPNAEIYNNGLKAFLDQAKK